MELKEEKEKFRISLAAARVNVNMTQEDVAKKMQVGKQTVGNWEKGKVVPKPAQFEMLCNIYSVPKDIIFLKQT
ncbi:MAG: helix-turn-helix transcriptional regulator [Lachnospiraceae bacterium]|nr:helix-turn-helix transcriptional regulator [Lachnospiraceae bacterium]